MLRKLLSHAAIYGLAAQIPRVAGVLALPIITPYLTTTDYGVAGVVTAYATALGMVQSLGLSVVMVNAFVKHPTRYKWVWRQVHGFISLWSILYGAVLAGVLYLGMPDEAAGNSWTIILLHVIPALFFNEISQYAGLFFQLKQKPFIVAIQSFIVGLLTVFLNIYFIAEMHLGYMGWFYSTFVGVLIRFLLIVYPLYIKERMWPIFRFKWHRIKPSLRISLPVIPHQLSFFLLDASDKLILDFLHVPVPRIGFYNIASSFGLYFAAASNAVVQAANPLYVQFHAMGDSFSIRRITFSLQVLFFTVTSIASIWMKEIFHLLIINNDLNQAYPLAIVILMGYNYRPMYLAVVNQLTYQEKTKGLWKISTIASVGNILLNLALIPVYGIEAAAFTTFFSLMYMGYSGYFFNDYKGVQSVRFYPVLWLCINIGLLLFVYQMVDLDISFKMAATFLLAIACTIFLLKLNRGYTQF